MIDLHCNTGGCRQGRLLGRWSSTNQLSMGGAYSLAKDSIADTFCRRMLQPAANEIQWSVNWIIVGVNYIIHYH